jgi:limonene-1,2-epoxide hydrolase
MTLTEEQIAEAFSRHHFKAAYPYLADGVRWNIVGDKLVEGKEVVIAVCGESAAYLAGVKTDVVRFRAIVTAGCVVIDSVAEYTAEADEGISRVASCDIYDFADGQVSEITSYTVELGAG